MGLFGTPAPEPSAVASLDMSGLRAPVELCAVVVFVLAKTDWAMTWLEDDAEDSEISALISDSQRSKTRSLARLDEVPLFRARCRQSDRCALWCLRSRQGRACHVLLRFIKFRIEEYLVQSGLDYTILEVCFL